MYKCIHIICMASLSIDVNVRVVHFSKDYLFKRIISMVGPLMGKTTIFPLAANKTANLLFCWK